MERPTILLAGQLVSVATAAAILDLDPSAVRRALASGRLQGTKIGHEWLVDAGSIKAYKPIRRPKPTRDRS